jgi:hypothetical protein
VFFVMLSYLDYTEDFSLLGVIFRIHLYLYFRVRNKCGHKKNVLKNCKLNARKVRPPCEPRYVIHCVGNLTEDMCGVYLNFPLSFEYRKCV